MAKKYQLTGVKSYNILSRTFVEGVDYTEEEVGKAWNSVNEQGELYFSEVDEEGEPVPVVTGKRSFKVGKKSQKPTVTYVTKSSVDDPDEGILEAGDVFDLGLDLSDLNSGVEV